MPAQYTGAVLKIEMLNAATSVDLADLLPAPGQQVTALLGRTSGQRDLAVSTTDARGCRDLTRYTRDGDRWRALDRTRFFLDAETFTEAERHRSQRGANLHPFPICLPRELKLGEWHRPLPVGKVCLAWAGTALLRRPGVEPERCRVGALLAAEGRERRMQWLAEGLGEIAIGPPKGAFEWWLLGASNGEQHWLGGVPDGLLVLPREPLPEDDGTLPTTTLL